MSEESHFVRTRGRIQGPFTTAQLQAMARRGQFGRMHEVSTDGLNWVRASTKPELLGSEPLTLGAEPTPPPAGAAPQATPQADVWHYHQLGTKVGPVDLGQLQFLANTRQLSPTDMVWKQGMPEWIPAGRVPGLFQTSGGAVIQPAVYPGGGAGYERAAAEPPSISGLAIASLVLGVLWVCGLGSLLAIIFGAVALYQIRISKGRVTGAGLAIAGLVLGIVLLMVQAIYLLAPLLWAL
jgi:hypothetical protein